MKIEVAKPDLEAALKVASVGTLAAGNDLSSHYVFRVKEDGQVEVLSNNTRIGIAMPIAGCKVTREEGPTAFSLEAWRLNKWITGVEDSVVTLTLADGSVKASSPRGHAVFQSLDPSQFPYWDKLFAETEVTTTVPGPRFHAALSQVRLFISDKETTAPKLAQTESCKGALQATDKGAFVAVSLAEFEKSTLRIHGKDLGQVLSFLSNCGTDPVEVREHERCLFLVRPDGGVLSVGRPPHAFPEVTFDRKEGDPAWWTVRVVDLKKTINFLVAAAAKEDTRMNFVLDGGVVRVSMSSATVGERSSIDIEALEHGQAEDINPPMPEEGFDVPYPYLLKVLGEWCGETIRFGLNPKLDKHKKMCGWIRFREDRGGDDYISLLIWLA
jgi:hypothetical protein